MTPVQLRQLADLLLPGDEAGLPPGSRVPDVMLALTESTAPIIAQIGRHPDFAYPEKRQAVLDDMERSHGQEFRDLVLSLIKPYYEAGPVLEAMGWRTAPPQPTGHELAPMAADLTQALAEIAARKRIWR
ncbi:hypothetical protein [Taklimakanibacter albus]|uniref:Uncharacterized protein n=1 Tax=Taklimakanibacter albus TaxID=2800327 RepID=A0ACC5R1W8_9HYPH|nr:hypothetical protein [Aestuariivirga sp. YIM B02566]MBK1866466.1 hypothetical protein [Aestuariivirga sp. YIM B02566]